MHIPKNTTQILYSLTKYLPTTPEVADFTEYTTSA